MAGTMTLSSNADYGNGSEVGVTTQDRQGKGPGSMEFTAAYMVAQRARWPF